MYPEQSRHYESARITQQVTPALEAAIREIAASHPGADAQQISDVFASRGQAVHTATIRTVLSR